VLRSAPWLFAAGALAAFVSTLDMAADSGVTALLDLLVGPYVAAGVVGASFAHLRQDRPGGVFFDRARTYVLRLFAAYLLAGLLSLVVLAVPALVAWGELKPELVTFVEGGSPAFGGADALFVGVLVVAGFLVSLAFSLVAPAVVDGHGITGSLGESYHRVLSNRRAALAFGVLDGVGRLVAVAPGFYVVVASLAGDPGALESLGATAFLLLFAGGTVATTFGHVYATAFYERLDAPDRHDGR
jgi:hypothetical protein